MPLILASLRLAIALVLAATALGRSGAAAPGATHGRPLARASRRSGDRRRCGDPRALRLRDPIVVLVETSHPDGIFNIETLPRVRRLSDSLAALPAVGVEERREPRTERRDRVYPGTPNPVAEALLSTRL